MNKYTEINREDFGDGIQLVEYHLDDSADVKTAISLAISQKQVELAVLSQFINVMGNRLDIVRARRYALKNMPGSSIISEYQEKTYGYLLTSPGNLDAGTLAGKRSGVWVVADERQDKLREAFHSLRLSFGNGGFETNISLLVDNCQAAARYWLHGKRTFQVFYKEALS